MEPDVERRLRVRLAGADRYHLHTTMISVADLRALLNDWQERGERLEEIEMQTDPLSSAVE